MVVWYRALYRLQRLRYEVICAYRRFRGKTINPFEAVWTHCAWKDCYDGWFRPSVYKLVKYRCEHCEHVAGIYSSLCPTHGKVKLVEVLVEDRLAKKGNPYAEY